MHKSLDTDSTNLVESFIYTDPTSTKDRPQNTCVSLLVLQSLFAYRIGWISLPWVRQRINVTQSNGGSPLGRLQLNLTTGNEGLKILQGTLTVVLLFAIKPKRIMMDQL